MKKNLAWIAGALMALAVGCAGSQKPDPATPANPSDPTMAPNQPPPGDPSMAPPPANPCQPQPTPK